MSNIHCIQFPQGSTPRKDQRLNAQQLLSSVWQDNPTPNRVCAASPQPVPQKNRARTHRMDTKPPRIQKQASRKRKTVHLALWVKPGVKEALQRIAEREQLSVSATGTAFLEKAIESDLHEQHGALLEPIINQAIRRGMRAYSDRIAFLLVRVAFASEQTRSIVTNILRRQPGITPELLNTILDGSSKTAKRNISRRTPQLETLLTEIEKLFTNAEQ